MMMELTEFVDVKKIHKFCTVIDQSVFIWDNSCSIEHMNRIEDPKTYFSYY